MDSQGFNTFLSNTIIVFLIQIIIFSLPPFYIVTLRRRLRSAAFYTYVSIVLVIGGFLGSVYSIPLSDSLTVSGGNLTYGALMYATILLVIVEGNIFAIRNVIRLVITVNVLKYILYSIFSWTLSLDVILNPFDVAPELFSVSARFMIIGGALIILELLILLFAFERIKIRVNNYYAVSGLYIFTFIVVLLLDGVLFPFLAFGFDPALIDIVVGGAGGKFIMAVAYSLSIFVFLVTFRNRVSTYIDTPLDFSNLLTASREKLITEVERQQKSLAGAELLLAESHSRLQALFDHSQDAILLANDQGRYIDVNPAASALTGYSREELLQLSVWDLTPATNQAEGEELWRQFLTAGKGEGNYAIQGKDGRLVETEFRAVANIVPGLHLSIIRDVTTQRQQQLELQKTKKLLEKTFNSLQEAVFVIDPQERTIVTCNPAVEQVFGYKPDELIGQKSDILYQSPADFRRFGELSRPALDQSGVFHTDYKMQHKNGAAIMTENTVTALEDTGEWRKGVVSVVRDVTERKQAEEALRAREAELMEAQRIGKMGSWQLDIVQGRLTWSEQIYEIFGINKETFSGTFDAFLEFVHPEDRERLMQAQMPAEQGDAPLDIEHRIIRPDGEIRYVHERAEAIFNGGDAPVKLIGTVQDISARSRAEAALQETNERLRAIIESSPVGIIVLTLDGLVTMWSPAAEHIFGWTAEEVVGRPYPGAVQPGMSSEFKQNLAQLAAGEALDGFETQRQRKDGTVVDVMLNLAPVFDRSGEVIAAMGLVSNITAQKEALRQLQASEEKFRRLFYLMPAGVFTKDMDGRYTSTNDRTHIYTEQSPLGRTDAEIQPPEIAAQIRKNDLQVLAREETMVFEEEFLSPGGPRWLLSHKTPLRDEQGHIIGILGATQDITIRKQAERQLQDYTQRLEALHEIDRAILAQNSPEEIAEAAVDHLSRLIDCQHISAGWIDEAGDSATVLAAYVKDGPTNMPPGQSVPIKGNQAALAKLRQGETYLFPDLPQFAHLSPVIGQLVQEGLRSYMTVPLLAGGQLIGTLSLGSEKKNAFDKSHERFVKDVASQLAIALQQAQLLAAEQAQRLLAETLQQTAVTLGGSLSLPETLDAILNQLALVVDYDLAQVLLIEGEMLTVGARQGVLADGTETELTRPYTEIQPLHQALQSGKPIVLSDREITEKHLSLPGLTAKLMAWVGVPLIARDVAVGFLTVGAARDAYHHRERQAIIAFAQHAALAIEKATILTDLQNSLRSLQEAQARLLQAARLSAIGETAAGVAHQINNPLMTVVIDSHLLMKNLPADHPARESAVAIHQAARRAARIVQRLLDFSQTEPSRKTAVDVGDSVQEAVTLVAAQLPPAISLSLHATANLPPVQASPDHLQDVWLNLLLNARDAVLSADGGNIRVDVTYNEAEQQIEVAVTDDGVGISADEQSKLFIPFYTTKSQGTGLGLAVCYDIVKHHAGTIHVHSAAGEGATFTVVLPLSATSAKSSG